MFGPQLTGADIEKIQESLLALGFANTSSLVFQSWKKEQIKQSQIPQSEEAKVAKGKATKARVRIACATPVAN